GRLLHRQQNHHQHPRDRGRHHPRPDAAPRRQSPRHHRTQPHRTRWHHRRSQTRSHHHRHHRRRREPLRRETHRPPVQTTPEVHRTPPPGLHVPRQKTHPLLPRGDRGLLRRTRPHHRHARRQNHRKATRNRR